MKEKFMTRQQLANDLGISTRTLTRKLIAHKINVPAGLIPPKLYQDLVEKLRN